jgi:pyrimidine deaminase RibD-like protein
MHICAKKTVVAKVRSTTGKIYYGSNSCVNYVAECPREVGEGYEKCHSVCGQKAHAEVEALKKAGKEAIGGTLTVYGHFRICEDCAIMALNYGIAKIIIEVAP